ncbi:thiamine-phosphate kinase [Allohahella sp. A8]|uniref:thiamine-phosphate kinase n=1 Tax=Allohahella sp. A8 TaxID=3141461 RepID=UPI000C09E86E|nr:thiamine-phosphate kinase [Hahellaceae bacterium]|tara:strand:- start:5807 stop:6808 length:1002 start_codon:yes stop_codon:yes gene_type:complete
MNEFELIEQYFLSNKTNRQRAARITAVGNGDDCTVLAHLEGRLAISTDTVVHGRHVPTSSPAAWLASRGLGSSVSDLVAMGARPLGFTLALTMPHVSQGWLKGFSDALFRAADLYDCALLGGDVTRGPLTASFTVFGELPAAGRLLTRDSAQCGDRIWVSGALGAAGGALALFDRKLSPHDSDYRSRLQLISAYASPNLPIDLGLQLQSDAQVHSAIDISDGLLADLAHIAKASRVDIHLDSKAVPVAPALFDIYSPDQALLYALSGGDDYQLGFTAASGWTIGDGSATPIGEAVDGQGRVFVDGRPVGEWFDALSSRLPAGVPLSEGYQHFG